MFVSLWFPVQVNNLKNVSFELIRKLTIKQRAHKKVDYKTKYFSLTPHVGCAHKETKFMVSNDK